MHRKPICRKILNQTQYLQIQRYYKEYRKEGTVRGHKLADINDLIDVINFVFNCNKSERTLRRIWRNEYDISMFPTK